VNDWDLQAATPNPAPHLTKAIIMREEIKTQSQAGGTSKTFVCKGVGF